MAANPAAGVTEIPSAFKLAYDCAAANKVLSSNYSDFKVECYNGNYIVPNTVPPADACVDPEPCELLQIVSMVPPPPAFLVTSANLSTTINHGEKVDYSCPAGKFLDTAFDADDDGLFNLEC